MTFAVIFLFAVILVLVRAVMSFVVILVLVRAIMTFVAIRVVARRFWTGDIAAATFPIPCVAMGIITVPAYIGGAASIG